MKKLIFILVFSMLLTGGVYAGSEGQENMSKDSNGQVKDCFEGVNRGIFAFNQALDKVIVEPLAKGYRQLPSPLRTGTSNFISNISLLVSIPNNLLQGDFMLATKNTGRFAVNTTLGI